MSKVKNDQDSAIAAEPETLRDKVDELLKKLEERPDDIAQAQGKLDLARAELAATQSHLAQLQQHAQAEFKQLTDRATQLKNEFKAVQTDAGHVSNLFAQLRPEAATPALLVTLLNKLNDLINELDEMATLSVAVALMAPDRIKYLKNTLADAPEKLTDAQNDLNTLKDQAKQGFKQLIEQATQLKSEFEAVQTDVGYVSNLFAQLRPETATPALLGTLINHLNDLIDELRRVKALTPDAALSQSDKVKYLKNTLADAPGKLTDAQNDLNALKDQAKQGFKQLIEQATQLKSEFEAVQTDAGYVSNLFTQLRPETATPALLGTLINHLNDLIDELRRVKALTPDAALSQSDKVKYLKDILADAPGKLTDAQNDLNTLKDHAKQGFKQLIEQATQFKGEFEAVQTDAGHVSNLFARLKPETATPALLEILLNHLNDLINELRRVKALTPNAALSQSDKVKYLKDTLADAPGKLTDAQNDLNTLKDQARQGFKQLTDQAKQLKSEFEAVQTEAGHVSNLLAQLKPETATPALLGTLINHLNDLIDELDGVVTLSADAALLVPDKVKYLKDTLADAPGKLTDAQNDLNTLKDQAKHGFKQLSDRATQLEGEFEAVQMDAGHVSNLFAQLGSETPTPLEILRDKLDAQLKGLQEVQALTAETVLHNSNDVADAPGKPTDAQNDLQVLQHHAEQGFKQLSDRATQLEVEFEPVQTDTDKVSELFTQPGSGPIAPVETLRDQVDVHLKGLEEEAAETALQNPDNISQARGKFDAARAERAATQSDLAQLQQQARAEFKRQLSEQVTQLKGEFEAVQTDTDKVSELFAQLGSEPPAPLEILRDKLDAHLKGLEAVALTAEAALQNPDDISQAQRKLDAARAELAATQSDLAQLQQQARAEFKRQLSEQVTQLKGEFEAVQTDTDKVSELFAQLGSEPPAPLENPRDEL